MPDPSPSPLPHAILMLGIGGIGMSALARHLAAQGRRVAGYDLTPSPITAALEAEGVAVSFSPDPTHLPPWVQDAGPDDLLVVHTPAVPADFPLRGWCRERRWATVKRAELLGRITAGKPTLAVAGTHGKTTTSSWLAHMLRHEGCHAFLGGIDPQTGSNYVSTPGATWHVVEADEFDRSFLHLQPTHAAVTTLDPDHLDVYGNADAFRAAFHEFGQRVTGKLLWPLNTHDAPNGREVERFAVLEGPQTLEAMGRECRHAAMLRGEGTALFCLDHGLDTEVRFEAKPALPGHHNLANALVASALAFHAGVPAARLAEGVATFGGVKRRMDIHLDTPEAAYVDDYAHHPAELNALLQAVRERWPGRHVTLVFQPHLYSRTRDFAPEFASVLAQTDRLVLLPIYPAREQPIPGVDAQWLFENISAPHKQLSSSDSIFTSLKAGPLDVLVTAGAGDIDRLVPQALQLMRDRQK